MRIGFIGAGFIARGLALHAIRNGHEVMLSNSRGPQTLRSTVAALRCKSGTAEEAAAFGEIVFLALPLMNYKDIPVVPLAGKIVVDVNNHYPDRDGPMPELEGITTSELIARHLPQSKVVKAFNAIMANDLERDTRLAGTPDRRALPLAGDDADAKRSVAGLIDQFGFDPVDAGPLSESWRFERARPVYCVPFDKAGMMQTLSATGRSVFVGEYSWRP
jgi:8-hydroxy-5-deazaflavin:NADPH oxidoreductase